MVLYTINIISKACIILHRRFRLAPLRLMLSVSDHRCRTCDEVCPPRHTVSLHVEFAQSLTVSTCHTMVEYSCSPRPFAQARLQSTKLLASEALLSQDLAALVLAFDCCTTCPCGRPSHHKICSSGNRACNAVLPDVLPAAQPSRQLFVNGCPETAISLSF
jgi:hypothetical protein